MVKKNNNRIIILLAVILAVGLIALMSINQSILSTQGKMQIKDNYNTLGLGRFPIFTGELKLGGMTGTYETAYLGTIISSSEIVLSGQNNDGRITISNSFSEGNEALMIRSKMETRGRGNPAYNYFEAEFDLPKGEINLQCELTTQGTDDASVCGIKGLYKLEVDNQVSQSKNNVIVLENSRKVVFYVYSYATHDGSSSAKMIIKFDDDTGDTTGEDDDDDDDTGDTTGGDDGDDTGDDTTGDTTGGTGSDSDGTSGEFPYYLLGVGFLLLVMILIFSLIKSTRKKRR